MASNEFLWKPSSKADGNLVVLTPNNLNNQIGQVYVVSPSGQVVPGQFSGNQHNGQRGHFRFDRPGGQFPNNSRVVVQLQDGRSVVYDIGRTGSRSQGTPGAVAETGDPNQLIPGSSDVQLSENDIGFEDSQGFAFPQADFSSLDFQDINPSFIPNIQVPVVDPIERTGEVGEFNRFQFQRNLAQGSQNALDLLELEFQGLEQFNREARALQQEGIIDENAFNQAQVAAANKFNRSEIPAANEFNRGQVTEANIFNQQERLRQLETALPGARDTILAGLDRNAQLAEGVLPDSIEDRAFEIASRSAAADASSIRGFGDDSTFSRRTSDILSAQQRLEVGQLGEAGISRFLSLGANLAFDQPIKQNPVLDQPLVFQPQLANTSQDVRGRPERGAATLAVEQQSFLNPLTTITPGQAIQFDIGQNQFQASLDQRTNEFNSNLDFNAQKVNSSADLEVQLEQLNSEVFNAQQESNAINAGIESQLAQDRFQAGVDAGGQAAIFNTVGQVAGAAATIFGRGGSAGSPATAAGAVEAGAAALPASVGGQAVVGSAATSSGAPGFLLADGSVVAQSEASAFLGSSPSLPSLGSLGPASVLAAASVATGLGLVDTARGLTDGSISEDDVKRGFANIFPGGAIPQGVNEIIGGDFNENDISNAALLTNPATAPIALADMAGSALGLDFGSGKGKQQQKRDALRSHGADLGLFVVGQGEEDGLREGFHHVQLADGSFYNIGLDGGETIQNYGVNPVDGKTERSTFDVDWSDPRAGQAVSYANPVALMVFGENAPSMMGHMVNSATSNNNSLSETKRNIHSYANQAGIDYTQGVRLLEQHRQAGNISDREYYVFLNNWNDLMLVDGVENEVIV